MKTAIAVCFSVLPRSICCNRDITHKTSHLEPKHIICIYVILKLIYTSLLKWFLRYAKHRNYVPSALTLPFVTFISPYIYNYFKWFSRFN